MLKVSFLRGDICRADIEMSAPLVDLNLAKPEIFGKNRLHPKAQLSATPHKSELSIGAGGGEDTKRNLKHVKDRAAPAGQFGDEDHVDLAGLRPQL